MNADELVLEPASVAAPAPTPAPLAKIDPGLSEVEKNWNEFGKRDPLWAILTDESKRNNQWDLAEFFATGEREIDGVLQHADSLKHNFTKGKALDFGCGVGRLTQALGRHFEECHGIDIASSMVEQARQYNRHGARCHYHVNTQPNLELFATGTFDFVYTNIVLQHNPPAMSKRFIQEFLRILKPGGLLVFQLPSEPLQVFSATGAPLKGEGFRAQLSLVDDATPWLAGTTRKITVKVKNLSPITWPGKGNSGQYPVRIGNHWRDAHHRVVINDDARADIPADLAANEEISVPVNVTIPGRPGTYHLDLDMVQENVAWFGGKGSKTEVIRVEVIPNTQISQPAVAAPQAAAAAPAVLIPRMEMNGIRKNDMLAFLGEHGAQVLQAANDNSASGWVSYRYFVTKTAASLSPARTKAVSAPTPASGLAATQNLLAQIDPAYRPACEKLLAKHEVAAHPQFLVAAYNFCFQRGIDEAGYNENLIKLYAGFNRAELLRDFLMSGEFHALKSLPGFALPAVADFVPATPLPPRSTLEQYQDIWIKGKLHQRGVRECADRFELIRDFCKQFNRPFTILDIGSNLAYMSLRLTETFDCTSVAVEGIYGEWIQEVLEANETSRVILLRKIIKLADLRALAEVEHFDLVLGLSVIHHLDGSFDESLEVLRSLGDHLILELPFEANACGQQLVQEAVKTKLPDDAVFMGFGKSHLAEGQRQIVRLSRPKTKITKSYLGTPRTDLSLTIHSDFNGKRVEFHNKPECRPWLRGINLQTYLWLNGAYPSKPQIANALLAAVPPTRQHRDIQSWNIVLQGKTLELIDCDDPNHTFNYSDQQYLQRLIFLLRAESVGAAAAGGWKPGHELSAPSKLNLPVRWRGPIFNTSGYASEAINYVLPLSEEVKLGIHHQNNIYSEKFVAGLPAADRARLFGLRDNYSKLTGGIVIEHNPANGFTRLPDAAYCIGRTMFETDRIPAAWVAACNQMDEVWVPSKFNLETFAASGVLRDKLVVIPESVDENEFNPINHQPLPLPGRATFNFLAIFEWSRRKGWDVLLSAYLREFSAADDVCLYLRTYLFSRPDGDPSVAIQKLIDEHAAKLNLGDKPLPRIHIIAEQVAQADLPRLYKAADCLVAPSRGEGWGRPHHEAMMMGLPVIATNWSGNTEFMNAGNSYLIECELTDTVSLDPELRHYRNQRWAEPSEKSLRQHMRQVQQHPLLAQAKGLRARREMLRSYSRGPVTKLVVARLLEIERKLSTPVCPAAATRHPATPSAPATSSKAARLRVNWEGSFLDLGSLSHVNRELTAALNAIDPNLQLTRVSAQTLPVTLADNVDLKNLSRRIESKSSANTEVTIRHAWPPNWQRPASGAFVVIQPWEFGALPADWMRHLANVDEVWAPSEYVRRVYLESGLHPDKVKVVPNGIDPQKFRPGLEPLKLATQKKFKFLFVGGTIARKGPDVLLNAYLKTFTDADDVCLVIKDFGGQSVYQGQTLEKQIAAAQLQPGAPEILYLTTELSPAEMPRLYASCDCLLHPYRGEGFGLPVLEAMACALPVVVTGGGSTDDFAPDEFAMRLPALKTSLGAAVAGLKLTHNGWWLEPNAAAFAERLRWIAANPAPAKAMGLAASNYVRREWTWERAAQVAAARLREVAARKQAEVAATVARRARKAEGIKLPEVALLGNLSSARELLANKNFIGAWSAAVAALNVRPCHPEAWLLLAEIAKAAGDGNQSRVCAERAVALAPNWKPAKNFVKGVFKTDRSLEWAALPAPSAAPRLTVCLITRNEEKFLPQCLASIRDIAHQIIVVDTGSTDATIAIAKKFNAEVHHFAWSDDFSAARNVALKHATGDWVLSLDADEELLAEHRATLLREIQSADVMAYRLPIVNIDREEEGASFVPRLFRNAPGLFYIGRIHEQIFSSVQVRAREWNLQNRHGQSALLHHGYAKEVVLTRDKVARNLRLLELAIEEMPNEPNLLMNYGLELVRSGQQQEGLNQTLEALHIMSRLPAEQIVPELRETLFTQISSQLLTGKLYRDLVELWQNSFVKAAGQTASQHFALGLAYLELKQPAEAAMQMRACLAKRHLPTLSPVNPEILKAGPNHCLALAHIAAKNETAAEAAFHAALKDDPSACRVRFDFARFLSTAQPVAALQMLHALVTEDATDASVWEFGAQLALSQPQFLDFAQNWASEAIKNLPANAALRAFYAEALLLAENAAVALQFFTPNNPRQLAAEILCQAVTGNPFSAVPTAHEKTVSQEFLAWYRKLIKFNAVKVLHPLNNSLATLPLPTAQASLRAALTRATVPAVN